MICYLMMLVLLEKEKLRFSFGSSQADISLKDGGITRDKFILLANQKRKVAKTRIVLMSISSNCLIPQRTSPDIFSR